VATGNLLEKIVRLGAWTLTLSLPQRRLLFTMKALFPVVSSPTGLFMNTMLLPFPKTRLVCVFETFNTDHLSSFFFTVHINGVTRVKFKSPKFLKISLHLIGKIHDQFSCKIVNFFCCELNCSGISYRFGSFSLICFGFSFMRIV